jgi:glucose-1-phosphate adenylyltransferase
VDRGSDVTIGAIPVPLEQARDFGVIDVDEHDAVTRFEEKPTNPRAIPGRPGTALASMGIYVFQTGLLKQVLNEDRQDPGSSHDFGKDILPKLIRHQRVNAYHFVDENRKKTHYWRDVGTVDAYWEANMDLVEVDPVFNLYDRTWPIHTYIKPAPPAKFVFAELVCETKEGRAGLSMDSLITHGDIIAGGQVINSVLSPNVRVNEHARVVQSILFEGVTVGAGSQLFRTIVDKKVNIPPNTRIGFNRAEDEKRFPVSSEGVVVVARGTEF